MNVQSNKDYTTTYDTDSHKPSGKKFRPQFYSSGHYAFINLDPEILLKLKVTYADEFAEIILNDNEILLRRIPRT